MKRSLDSLISSELIAVGGDYIINPGKADYFEGSFFWVDQYKALHISK